MSEFERNAGVTAMKNNCKPKIYTWLNIRWLLAFFMHMIVIICEKNFPFLIGRRQCKFYCGEITKYNPAPKAIPWWQLLLVWDLRVARTLMQTLASQFSCINPVNNQWHSFQNINIILCLGNPSSTWLPQSTRSHRETDHVEFNGLWKTDRN